MQNQISIHALREEGDAPKKVAEATWQNISIHALREEGDRRGRGLCGACCRFLSTPSARRATFPTCRPASAPRQFLSTPSARRATPDDPLFRGGLKHFYPRPPRGGRRRCVVNCVSFKVISIHALREEGDPQMIPVALEAGHISIHALREEGDYTAYLCMSNHGYFYPRPPRGGRRFRPLCR